MFYAGIYKIESFYPSVHLPLMGMSLATKRRGGELLSFYHRVAFEISNYCDRHFNRKNAVWSVGFIVVQFFKCNLQFNMRNKSARRRLPVNGRLAFVRIFLF